MPAALRAMSCGAALRHHAIASDETGLSLIALRADRHFSALVHAGVSLAPGARES